MDEAFNEPSIKRMEARKQEQINKYLKESEREEEIWNDIFRKYLGINAMDGISNPRLTVTKFKDLIEKGIPIYDKNGLPIDNITLENIKDLKYDIDLEFEEDFNYSNIESHTKMEDGIITDCGVKYNFPINVTTYNPATDVYQKSEEPICNYVFNLNKA